MTNIQDGRALLNHNLSLCLWWKILVVQSQKRQKLRKRNRDLSASTGMLTPGGRMYHVRGGESLNDILSDTRKGLCLSLRSDVPKRCLKEQIRHAKWDLAAWTWTQGSKKSTPRKEPGRCGIKTLASGSYPRGTTGLCFEDDCPYSSSPGCFIFPWAFQEPKSTDDLLTSSCFIQQVFTPLLWLVIF